MPCLISALFTITIAANNGIILQNVHWAGLHIGIKGKKATVFVSTCCTCISIYILIHVHNYLYIRASFICQF